MNKKLSKQLGEIAKRHKLSLLVLFGSRATSNYTKTSDWDFAYYPNKFFTSEDDMKLFNDIIATIKDEKVDLLNIKTSKKLHVVKNVFQKCILIYEKEVGLFSKMKWDAWMNLQDFKYYYEWESELVTKELEKMVENG